MTDTEGANLPEDRTEWYREVLSLDPSSRIFLPLARLLAQQKRPDEAVAILRKGLAFHPEFLEARLFLITLLHADKRESAAQAEAAGLIETLSSSSAFWEVWSRSPGTRPDLAPLLMFFSASMHSKKPISITDVFETGIKELAKKSDTATAPDTNSIIPSSDEAEQTTPPCSAEQPPKDLPVSPVLPDEKITEAPAAQTGIFTMPPDLTWQALDSVPDEDDILDDIPEEQPSVSAAELSAIQGKISLRTRSMARLLAEQGAPDEAADIYRELMAAASSPDEKAELKTEIDGLAPASGQQNQSELLNMLEKLAERLETRSRV